MRSRSIILFTPTCLARLGLGWLLAVSPLSAATPRFAISHFAGSTGGGGSSDGMGTAARFRFPGNLASDRNGNIYVADEGNFTLRKITPDGMVTTFAGSPGQPGSDDGIGAATRFRLPGGMVADSAGNLYVADLGNFTVRKVTPTGGVTTLAGEAGQPGEADGVGSAARFADIVSLTIDGNDTIYALDTDDTPRRRSVRRITTTGSVTTFAVHDGNPFHPVSFREFSTIAADPAGNLHLVDISAQLLSERFLVISPNGAATRVSGANVNGSIGASVIDPAGNFYLTYPFAQSGIVKIAPGPTVFTGGYTITTSGPASTLGSQLADAVGLTMDPAGNLYVSLQGSHMIRKITPAGTVTPFAGLAPEAGVADGTGTDARFRAPYGLALDPAGNLYVADWSNSAIRKITPTGTVTTVVIRDVGAAAAAGVGLITSIAIDPAGNLYAADQVRRVVRRFAPDGSVTTIAGTLDGFGHADGVGPVAQFDSLHGAALDRQGNFYTAGLSAIRKVTPAGVVTTIAGSPTETGSADGPAASARFFQPFALTVDGADNVYVADSYNHTIRKITPTGAVSTLAGAARQEGSADGTGSAARFSYPSGLKADGAGNLYVADSGNNTIRLVTADGTVTTLAGRSRVVGSDDGLDEAARFNSPADLALDGAGNLYIADAGNRAVRKATLLGFAPNITAQPQSQSVTAGGSVTFSITVAANSSAPTYQWYLNGSVLGGATGISLTVANAGPTNAGAYTVTVTNALGSVASNPATLTVTSGPANPPPGSGGNGAGGSGGGGPSLWFIIALLALGAARKRRG